MIHAIFVVIFAAFVLSLISGFTKEIRTIGVIFLSAVACAIIFILLRLCDVDPGHPAMLFLLLMVPLLAIICFVLFLGLVFIGALGRFEGVDYSQNNRSHIKTKSKNRINTSQLPAIVGILVIISVIFCGCCFTIYSNKKTALASAENKNDCVKKYPELPKIDGPIVFYTDDELLMKFGYHWEDVRKMSAEEKRDVASSCIHHNARIR